MEGGTEAFPDLGSHCQLSDCHQLDFLPFSCNACHKIFCLEHRSYKSHRCPNSDSGTRKVVVCEICSHAVETTGHGEEEERRILEMHACDPNNKKKPTCPVRRCKQVLTFSNTSSCKFCRIKVCLSHRYPTDHSCGKLQLLSPNKFLEALAARSGKDCGNNVTSPPAIKAC